MRPAIHHYYLAPARFPWLYIRCWKENTEGVILFRWLLVGIERIRRLHGDEVSIVWAYGLKPIKTDTPLGGKSSRGQP